MPQFVELAVDRGCRRWIIRKNGLRRFLIKMQCRDNFLQRYVILGECLAQLQDSARIAVHVLTQQIFRIHQ